MNGLHGRGGGEKESGDMITPASCLQAELSSIPATRRYLVLGVMEMHRRSSRLEP